MHLVPNKDTNWNMSYGVSLLLLGTLFLCIEMEHPQKPVSPAVRLNISNAIITAVKIVFQLCSSGYSTDK